MEGGRHAPKLQRKTIEKNRRELIKGLLFQLSSLIPTTQTSGSKDGALTRQGLLEQATTYIKNLKGNIETLKKEREALMEMNMLGSHRINGSDENYNKMAVQVRVGDAFMEVVLCSGLNKQQYFKLHEVISILEQEGADVIHASFSTVGDKILYTIHSQAISSRIGLDDKRIKERLENLV